ncbi:hypothetical protein [Paraburkholderia caballeronis]|uniref:hypothetical protein n=1 Tax=Paraburkholderia caballeronis TaxID=416943 RepID=UPI0010DDD6D9|nr:hypothetical protein [Paraburkholderia caballeronis]TDV11691.1 hypothetical protein C7408_11146 [Paraburkholderia caballeronis]TDV14772.1 hypothetical protein C7406_11246 [Paraburkholderia caballeronis]TDV23892.1 hypothetical protein C7404_11146 [Paraburkholderia caballeronis]
MRITMQSGTAALAVALATSLHPVPAHADGPRAAYDGGGQADASLDPGEEQMTADEENKARLQDLSDAYHSGYNARAKEDAETYASLRDQLKQVQKAPPSRDVPPLPPGMPDGDDASVAPVQPPQVAQRALPAQPAYRRLPPAQQYTMTPSYPPQAYDAAPAYQPPPPPVYQQPVIVQQAYAPPPPPPVVQYVPVYAQTEYAPPPPVYQQPVVTVSAPVSWSAYPPGYWSGYGYPPRAYGYRVWR